MSTLKLKGNALSLNNIPFSFYDLLQPSLTHYHNPDLTLLEKKALENIVGKVEHAGNQHFLLFSQCFLLFPTQISIFESLLFCCLQML